MKSKMAEIAKIFNKELDEEFYFGTEKESLKGKFTEFGLQVTPTRGNKMNYPPLYYLSFLATGEANIYDYQEHLKDGARNTDS